MSKPKQSRYERKKADEGTHGFGLEAEEKQVKEIRPKPKHIFRIIARAKQKVRGSYSRAYGDEYDFESVHAARHANCHGMFEDKEKYAIAEYIVHYELANPDVDGKG